MAFISSLLVFLIALEHIYFLYLEMFLWTQPKGLKTFGMSLEDAESSKVLAANQGLYNGFLAAGLLWGLFHPTAGGQIQAFFLFCIMIAGIYGGMTAKRTILYVQGGPAFIALLALWLS